MKKTFQLENLDCANCARKMEDAIRKIDGVEEVSISFLTQKMTVASSDAGFDDILKKIVKTCRKIEPDCIILF